MIQRIQSVFLFLAAALNIAVLFLPLWTKGSPEITIYGMQVTPSGVVDSPLPIIHLVVIGLVAAYLIGMIFLFKDRVKQARLTYFGIIGLMLQIGLMVFMTMTLGNEATGEGGPAFGFFFPVGSVLLTYLAVRYIKKDEELVKSTDRFY